MKKMLLKMEEREEEIVIGEEREVRARLDENGGASVVREKKSSMIFRH